MAKSYCYGISNVTVAQNTTIPGKHFYICHIWIHLLLTLRILPLFFTVRYVSEYVISDQIQIAFLLNVISFTTNPSKINFFHTQFYISVKSYSMTALYFPSRDPWPKHTPSSSNMLFHQTRRGNCDLAFNGSHEESQRVSFSASVIVQGRAELSCAASITQNVWKQPFFLVWSPVFLYPAALAASLFPLSDFSLPKIERPARERKTKPRINTSKEI